MYMQKWKAMFFKQTCLDSSPIFVYFSRYVFSSLIFMYIFEAHHCLVLCSASWTSLGTQQINDLINWMTQKWLEDLEGSLLCKGLHLLEDKHGTYKSPIWGSENDLPNLHDEMFHVNLQGSWIRLQDRIPKVTVTCVFSHQLLAR